MTRETMKAIRQHSFGGPEVLRDEDTPMPECKPGEVLVRTHAIGMNPPDWYLRDGFRSLPPQWRPQGDFPLILGTDVSGVVEAVASDVNQFSAGDEVFALIRFFSVGESKAYAQFVTVPARELAHKPAGIDHLHAAGAPMSLLTAWQFLVDVGHDEPNVLQPEPHRPVPLRHKTVVINGAAGGVGHFAVQIAKSKGANVIAVASGRHASLLRDLGADEFVDYTTTDAQEVIRGADLVLDTVGGAASSRFLKTIKPGGALFPVYPLGFDGAEEAERRGVGVSTVQVRSSGAQLAELAHRLDDGTIRVVVDSVFPLAEAGRAHERAEQGHIQGKIVLTVDEGSGPLHPTQQRPLL